MKSMFPKKKKANEDLALQITSMADIFMILLVFLLKSYSTSIANISPSQDTRLPVLGEVKGEIKDTLKVEISKESIMVDQKLIVPLSDFKVGAGVVSEDSSIKPLYDAMFAERKKRKDPNLDSTLLVLADEKTPYETLQAVMGSASRAGFVDLQLVVVEAN
jgi:biopolymer transport protein ExbD